ncbi:MAG: tetratricopeptide repeat protein [Candidatus Thermoplasmatota archaeon]|nr:tetratricopeptide repeat protein [Candidatus Thermoplasmatota archaeon]
MRTCPYCKAAVPDYATVCSKCWKTVEVPVKEKKEVTLMTKEDLDKALKQDISVLALPRIFELDTYVRLDQTQRKAVENLSSKLKDAIMQFGEEALGTESYLTLGNAALAVVDYNRALEYFNLVTKLDRANKEAWHNKGIAFYKLSKYSEAVKCFDEALAIDNSIAASWYCKGLALIYQGKLQEGTRCYERAIKLDPNLMKRAKWGK